jgi:hypothetical protein
LGRIPAEDVRRRFSVGGRREEERGRNNRRMELSSVLWGKHDSTRRKERERRREWSPTEPTTVGGVGEPRCVAAARLRQSNVARRGEDSGKDTGGGRDDKMTCERGKQSCRRSGAADGRRHARAAEE